MSELFYVAKMKLDPTLEEGERGGRKGGKNSADSQFPKKRRAKKEKSGKGEWGE